LLNIVFNNKIVSCYQKYIFFIFEQIKFGFGYLSYFYRNPNIYTILASVGGRWTALDTDTLQVISQAWA